MKILHTSDLHIGKRLYDIDLLEDQQLFFNWLVEFIKKESVDSLLVSGDVFDVANPSSEARRLYYELLVKLSDCNCKVIITGGNHDSPGVLEAPKEVLRALDIHVVGAKPAEVEQCFIPVSNKNGNVEAVIAAIPFLRDRDLRTMVEDESYKDRLEAIRLGILKTYREFAKLCEQKYPDVPAIAMGHLFVDRGTHSESERDVQVGNQAGVDGKNFPDYFSYYALGHLHSPQHISNNKHIKYSGSPYPLSFGEKDNVSRVILIDIDNKEISTSSVEIPKHRRLIKYAGTMEQVKDSLRSYVPEKTLFATLIEVEVLEEDFNPGMLTELESLEDDFNLENAQIVKSRIKFSKKIKGTDELYSVNKNIEDLAPKDVFLKRLKSESLPSNTEAQLIEAFDEILEMVRQEELDPR